MASHLKTDAEKLLDAEAIIRRKNTEAALSRKEIAGLKREIFKLETDLTKITELEGLVIDPPDWIIKQDDPKLPGVPITIWSDWHYGEIIDFHQTNGLNKFNRAIAKDRIKKLVHVTLDLTLRHVVNPKYPGIIICLGGDFISGNIHDELRETNDGPVAISYHEVQEQLAAALKVMADHFGQVFVPCVVGNHGRTTIKPRAKNRHFDNYDFFIYRGLASYFKDDPRVNFYIPNQTDAHFSVYGHRFLLTHGDGLGVKGGDGIIGAIGPIARGATKVGRSEAQVGRDFDTLLIGHYHTYIPRGDALPVVANGALKGFDEYARLMLRVPYSRPSQALFFIHEKYGFTQQWCIYLDGQKGAKQKGPWVSWPKE